MSQNGQIHFKNFAAFAARFLKRFGPFYDIAKKSLITVILITSRELEYYSNTWRISKTGQVKCHYLTYMYIRYKISPKLYVYKKFI